MSSWLNSQAIVNSDGVLYLQAAQAYALEGWDAAVAVYKWPFYSAAIAWTQTLTSLSLVNSAYALNTLLCVVIVTAFIQLIGALGGRLQEQVFAAVIILLHTGLNDYRDYIIRDLGHWAFMLYGLYFLILYSKKRQLRFALGFGLAMFTAFLFRTEALFVMLLAPLTLLFCNEHQYTFLKRLVHFLGAYSFAPVILTAVLIVYMIGPSELTQVQLSNPWLSRLEHIDYLRALETQIMQLRPAISANIPDNHLYYFLFGGFMAYFLVRLCLLLSPLYVLLTGYAIKQGLMKASPARALLCTYLIIYTLIVLGFLYYRFFLSGRYIMPIVLLLSLWAPFALSAWYEAWRSSKPGVVGKPWFFPLVIMGLIYMLGDSSISSTHLGFLTQTWYE
ncbi:MAG TPA: hypothetical protein VI522_04280 [Gammaproteobacteria bacterium]|nr:hypothetical protein [Gammaproteobacteria bacterium]